MDLKLKDKVAIVTGAGSQIGYGKAIALTLAEEGCDIIIGDIDIKGAEKVVKKAKKEKKKSEAPELEELGLSTRTINALIAAKIKTKKKLMSQKDKVAEIKGIGPKATEEIEKVLT